MYDLNFIVVMDIMYNNNKVLVVIPAKGSSKGIPSQNIRLLSNKPLISYSIDIAKSSKYVDDVVVTTDDSEISFIAEKFGAGIVRRPEDLSGDDVPLDSFVFHAIVQQEKIAFDEYDIVIILQPNSPLIKTETMDAVIEKFDDFLIDSVLTVVDDRHLSWGYDEENQKYFPNYFERLDRQHLPPSFRETGAILASRRTFMNENSCLGNNIDLVEVSLEESLNIDNFKDWWIAENYLNKRKIAIVVNDYDEIGNEHIDRCLTLASKVAFHQLLFLLDENHQLAIDCVDNYDYSYQLYDGVDDLFKKLNEYSPHIVINDIQDTDADYVMTLKEKGYFVVNFEDMGEGAEYADIVFDDLYEQDLSVNNAYTGHKYYILKDEFYFQPQKIITQNVDNVLLIFGADPNNYTEKVVDAILSTNYEGRIDVILGLGYDGLERLIEKYEPNPAVQIYQNVSNISDFMFKADIIFTSAGKTMYETCSLGVPTICLCQNERELSHVFGNNVNGFINLGLGYEKSQEEIMDEFINLVNNYEERVAMNEKMLNIDLKNGFSNIFSVLKEEYRNFEFSK